MGRQAHGRLAYVTAVIALIDHTRVVLLYTISWNIVTAKINSLGREFVNKKATQTGIRNTMRDMARPDLIQIVNHFPFDFVDCILPISLTNVQLV